MANNIDPEYKKEISEEYILLQEINNLFFKLSSPDRQYTLAYLVAKWGQGKKLCE